MMEAVRSFETSVNVTTQCYIPEYSKLKESFQFA
jgi:hypothetical protein